MTQEDKQLLLQDICGRLPYGVKVLYGWASSNAHCQTITALKRRLGKWKLPIGAKVCALGVFDERYEFTIKK